MYKLILILIFKNMCFLASNYKLKECVHIQLLFFLNAVIVQTVASLKSKVDGAAIPAPKKADIRAKIALLQVF